MIEDLFNLLCGFLYLIGIPFGWSYQDTSIYICIYLWPILCCLSTLPILYISVLTIRKHKIVGMILMLLSGMYSFYYVFYTNFIISRYGFGVPNAFNKCMIDLKFIAEQTRLSYAEINIFIYVVLFLGIISFNYLIFRGIRTYRARL